MKLIPFVIATILFGSYCFGQQYEPLSSKGVPPISFSTPIKTLLKDHKKSSSDSKGKEKKIEETLNAAIHYQIGEMLGSGKVLYGEDSYEYLNDLMKQILKKNKINKNIQVYGFKSSFSNAFATDAGILFVNLGLLSKISTENELAFALCHELSHYMLKHSLQGELIKYDQQKMAEKKAITAYDKLVQKHAFSQKFELQADSLGLVYFMEAGFKGDIAPDIFKILKDRHYVRDEVNLNSITNFSASLFDFDKSEVDSIVSVFTIKKQEFNEKFSTHPDIDERIERLADLMPDKTKGKKSIGSKKLLKNAIIAADLENLRVSLLEENYLEAVYYSEKVYQGKSYHEYGMSGYIRANIGLFLSKIYDGNLNPRFYYKSGLTDIELNEESIYTDVLSYYRLTPYQKLSEDISKLINKGLEEFPDSEEIKALNNWYIKWLNEEAIIELSNFTVKTSLKDIEVKKTEYEYNKKYLLNPDYIAVKTNLKRVDFKVDYSLIEKNKIKFHKKLMKADKKQQNLIDLSLGDRTKINEDKLKYTGIINARVSEIFSTPLNVPMPPVDYNVLTELCTKYNTERMVYASGLTLEMPRNPGAITLMMIFPYTIPLAIYQLIVPKGYSYFYYRDIDLLKGTYSDTYSDWQMSRKPVKTIKSIYLSK